MRIIVALTFTALALLLVAPPALADDTMGMVADINPTGSSSPRDFIAMDDVLYFSATDGVHGRELWRSDGTGNGTWLVRDIHRGSASSNPEPVAVVGSVLYFTAKDSAHGQELWKTDGTAAGTLLVKDITPGTIGGGYIYGGVGVGDLLYFDVDHYGWLDDSGLWVSDGTAAGTLRLGPTVPEYLTPFGNKLYFLREGHLWRSDGTFAGTKRLPWAPPRTYGLVATHDALYLTSQTLPKSTQCDLYKTDGTLSGLRRLTAQPLEGCYQLAVANNRVFFTQLHQLWRSDGTPRTTKVVATLTTYMWETWATGDCVWFNTWGEDGYPAELWNSDGTKAGTAQIDATPLPNAEFVVELGTSYYFVATRINYSSDPTTTWDLWRSDGTNAGTEHLTTVEMKGAWEQLVPANNQLFFPMDDGVHGAELWSYAP